MVSPVDQPHTVLIFLKRNVEWKDALPGTSLLRCTPQGVKAARCTQGVGYARDIACFQKVGQAQHANVHCSRRTRRHRAAVSDVSPSFRPDVTRSTLRMPLGVVEEDSALGPTFKESLRSVPSKWLQSQG
jgi:hypothetical protein